MYSTNCRQSNAKQLAVFERASLYSGTQLNSSNFHQFADRNNATGYFHDDPVYNPYAASDGREYLVNAATTSNGYAAVVYSYLEGSVDSPSFTPNAVTAASRVRAAMYPSKVSSYGCAFCINFQSSSWITLQLNFSRSRTGNPSL